VQETFRSFLQELEEPCSGKELLEAEVIEIMRKEGFSDAQVYDMPLKKLLDLFYDAYLWKANSILSKATVEAFLKKLLRILVLRVQ
jgi:hypothetical protein